jgi:hypothetical protein
MPDVQISPDDINNLARKLQNLSLDEHERAVLMAVIALAAEAIGNSGPLRSVQRPDPPTRVAVQTSGQLPSIADLFVHAFTPGLVGTGTEDPGDVVLVKIGR